MSSRIEIANAACIKAGVGTIAALDEVSEQARKIQASFDRLSRAELRRHAWNFAVKRTTLAATGTPPIGFNGSFRLPTDCLRLLQAGDYLIGLGDVRQTGDAPYAVEGGFIHASGRGVSSSLSIRYVADVTAEVASWDEAFAEAFACRLAQEIAPTLTKNLTKKRDLQNDYLMAIREAKRANAIEVPPADLGDDTWVLVRYTG